jgi:hypothetical protein
MDPPGGLIDAFHDLELARLLDWPLCAIALGDR